MVNADRTALRANKVNDVIASYRNAGIERNAAPYRSTQAAAA
jgi:hypothetical protein